MLTRLHQTTYYSRHLRMQPSSRHSGSHHIAFTLPFPIVALEILQHMLPNCISKQSQHLSTLPTRIILNTRPPALRKDHYSTTFSIHSRLPSLHYTRDTSAHVLDDDISCPSLSSTLFSIFSCTSASSFFFSPRSIPFVMENRDTSLRYSTSWNYTGHAAVLLAPEASDVDGLSIFFNTPLADTSLRIFSFLYSFSKLIVHFELAKRACASPNSEVF